MATIIQVILGLVLAYSLLSIIVSQVNTIVTTSMKTRAKFLRQNLASFIRDEKILERVKQHPLIRLVEEVDGKIQETNIDNVDPKILTDVLIDIADNTPLEDDLRKILDTLKGTQQKFVDAKENILKWIDSEMWQMTKQFQQMMLKYSFIVGTVLVVTLNVDTIYMAQSLWKDDALRDVVVENARQVTEAQVQAAQTADTQGVVPDGAEPPAQTDPDEAEKAVAEARSTVSDLLETGLPLGWTYEDETNENARNLRNLLPRSDIDDWFWFLVLKAIGWVITAIALSRGSDFWFNALRNLAGR